jgi:hypothetical protein
MSDTPRMPASYDVDISREPDYTEGTLEHARQLGAEAGKSAAGWVFDGNTAGETYRRVLRGIEAGDPEIMDAYRTPDLSGEYSGDYTSRDLAADLDIDEDADPDESGLNDAELAYMDAASGAFWAEVEREARSHVQPHGLDMDSAYAVADSPGVAWRIVSTDAVDGMVTAVMIGDDRPEDVDVSDLTPISDGDFCGGCGQIGCEADGRHS